jgi:hypothetical protein
VPELVVIVGPIASGKSTVAGALGRRFMAAGRAVAVLDLDDVVDTIGGFGDLTPQRFRQAQVVYGQLVGAWLRQSFDVNMARLLGVQAHALASRDERAMPTRSGQAPSMQQDVAVHAQPAARLFYVRSETRMKGSASDITMTSTKTAYTQPGRRTSPPPARSRTRSA